MRTMDDWQLLQSYAQTRSESAFAELVRRHIDWVYSVAVRQVGDIQLAEDVVQSVFALLARKAGTLRSGTVLGGWLFRSTCFVAKSSLRAERRRKTREEMASAMMTTARSDESEPSWELVAPNLDHAVASLCEGDRSAILLRFYERKSLSDVGQLLGISEEAAKKRVTRSVEKLRNLLTRRGVSLGTAALAGALLEKTVQAAPATVASSAIRASAISASATLPQLAREALNAWRWAKIKFASAAALSLVLLAILLHSVEGTRLFQFSSRDSQRSGASSVAQSVSGNSEKTQGANSQAARENPRLLFRAVSADTGQGISAARVPINYVANGEWISPDELVTADDGTCPIPLPEGNLSRLDVGVLKDGFVQKFYTWRSDYEEPLPPTYVLRLERAVSIGGHVRDLAGNSISNAQIALQFHGAGDSSDRERQRERLGFLNQVTAVKTDAHGDWRCALTPSGFEDFDIIARHPDFVEGWFAADFAQHALNTNFSQPDELWVGKAILQLEAGFQLGGVVLDDAGNPLIGARVSCMCHMNYTQDGVKTKNDGTFRLTGLAPGLQQISAWAKGFAPSLVAVQIGPTTSQPVFRLNHGSSFIFRIADEDGEGIPGAWAAIDLPIAHNADLQVTTGPDGRAVVGGIPTNLLKNLTFHAGARGYIWARNIRLQPGDPEPTIRLTKALRVTGTVIDSETHEPISDFKAIPCNAAFGCDRSESKRGQWGTYAVSFSESGPYQVRIEAEDYEPAVSPPMDAHPPEQVLDFLLHKKDKSRSIRGTVLFSNGEPAANIRVALLAFDSAATLYHGAFNKRSGILTTTDGQGAFKFDHNPQAHTLVAADAENGFARLRMHRSTQPFTLQLQPWGRIEGRVILSGRPAPDQQVTIRSGLLPYRSVQEGLYAGFDFIKTDTEGRFVCDMVPPGDFTLNLSYNNGQLLTHQTVAEVRAGETTQIQIGGHGSRVVGRFAVEAGSKVDWATQLISASLSTNRKKPSEQPPPVSDDFAARLKLLEFFDESEEWHAFERSAGLYPLQVASDGSFSAEDIPAGPYILTLSVADSPWLGNDSADPTARFRRKILASLREEVNVSNEPNNSSDPVNLGAFAAKPTLSARH